MPQELCVLSRFGTRMSWVVRHLISTGCREKMCSSPVRVITKGSTHSRGEATCMKSSSCAQGPKAEVRVLYWGRCTNRADRENEEQRVDAGSCEPTRIGTL